MLARTLIICTLVISSMVSSGCASGSRQDNWVKLEPDSYTESQAKSIAIKYDKNLDNLTARLNASKAFPYLSTGDEPIPHAAFFEKKRGEVSLSIYTTSFTRYNVLQTTKNSRCYDVFQEVVPEYLTMIKKAALLHPSLEFKSVSISVAYESSKFIEARSGGSGMTNGQAMALAVQNMRIADEINRSKISEMATFTIPLSYAKKFVDQDIDVDELVSKSVIILNGVRLKLENKINTQDQPIE